MSSIKRFFKPNTWKVILTAFFMTPFILGLLLFDYWGKGLYETISLWIFSILSFPLPILPESMGFPISLIELIIFWYLIACLIYSIFNSIKIKSQKKNFKQNTTLPRN